MCGHDGLAGCDGGCWGCGGDWVEGVGEEAEGYGDCSGEDVDYVEGPEGVEGLEAWEEEDADAKRWGGGGGRLCSCRVFRMCVWYQRVLCIWMEWHTTHDVLCVSGSMRLMEFQVLE